MAAEAARVLRFTRTERWFHWAHAAAFSLMLLTGLVLYLPMLAQAVGDRPLMKGIHLAAAGGWLTALLLVAVLGDRRALGRTRRELEAFDADDVLWLRRRRARLGRFNAGQKLHSVLQAVLAVLFVVSGILLLLGERHTGLRLPGTIALHDGSMFVAFWLVVGHLFKAAGSPQAMAAITGGTVPAAWAALHHPKWVPQPPGSPASGGRRPAGAAVALAALVAVAGVAGTVLLVSAS